MASKESDWQGGKAHGSVYRNPSSYLAEVKYRSESHHIYEKASFNIKKYGGEEAALKAAKEWQREQSEKHDLTKNKYRIEGNVLYVQLTHNKVMKTDFTPEAMKLVEEHFWHSFQKSDEIYYARTSIPESADETKPRTVKYFHNFYTGWECNDHINGDGLDNRLENLRKANTVINMRNTKKLYKSNTSGTKGVTITYNNHKEITGYAARWPSEGKPGERERQFFSVKRYGDDAETLAIRARKKACIELNIIDH